MAYVTDLWIIPNLTPDGAYGISTVNYSLP